MIIKAGTFTSEHRELLFNGPLSQYKRDLTDIPISFNIKSSPLRFCQLETI